MFCNGPGALGKRHQRFAISIRPTNVGLMKKTILKSLSPLNFTSCKRIGTAQMLLVGMNKKFIMNISDCIFISLGFWLNTFSQFEFCPSVQVFKNSCRAVVERHADGFDDPLPSVHCHIVHGYEDVTSLSRRAWSGKYPAQSNVFGEYHQRQSHVLLPLLGLPEYFSPFTRQNVSSKCQLRKVEGWKKEVLILKQVCCFL